jgi:hypothetical protein
MLRMKWLFLLLTIIFSVLGVAVIASNHYSLGWNTSLLGIGITIVCLLNLPVVFSFRKQWDRECRKTQNQCLTCGYSFTGNTIGFCPECGKPTHVSG